MAVGILFPVLKYGRPELHSRELRPAPHETIENKQEVTTIMNSMKRIAAAATLVLTLGGALAACGGQPDADVLQYGYYTPQHVYVVYPTPHVVHVSYKVYHSNTTMYSNPSVEKTYVKTHTTATTTVTKTSPGGSVSLNKTPTVTNRTVSKSVKVVTVHH